MRDVRRAEGLQGGKYGEDSGFAGRRNKGVNGGGFVSGGWRVDLWDNAECRRNQAQSIFVDKLPMSVSKRDLYKAFGKYGFISDIFISRKARQRIEGPFAFIRYAAYGGAVKAVGMMNNTYWGNDKLIVTMSKSNREVKGKPLAPIPKQKIVQRWVEIKKKQTELVQRKVIEAKWDDEQKQRLQRSLLGVCVKRIELRKVMEFLLEEWKGPGEIEVRDVGSYRCLITFSSTEIRDAAMENQLLQFVFDEVRSHWNIFWSLSRRVWIEVTGMPVGLWCTENFDRIAKLWGKVIRYDDRTEEAKSFSTARILIDSFQWEMIHEWINVKIDDQLFEVHMKEFGSEVCSVQSHPDR
ncbi:hypothetical protein PIB30_103208 [Stylosanthes scabra]|uniref:RRM domain-containing protein n=1 Tax=Stylosanthes scabra TaxID=79078 RepID=A0ABU6RY88_9FABA|nr:hypothetical protein [Stylosanthes scabra]